MEGTERYANVTFRADSLDLEPVRGLFAVCVCCTRPEAIADVAQPPIRRAGVVSMGGPQPGATHINLARHGCRSGTHLRHWLSGYKGT